ncbi:unnamed protein product [Closterium sp. NIES-65]|nr:unnamed protein product [Closterium sp. NIES-65]
MSEPDEHDHSPRGKQDHEVTRVYVVSDIHTDHAENMEWVERLAATRQRSEGSGKGRDVLILAGDVTDNLEVRASTPSLTFRTSDCHHCVRLLLTLALSGRRSAAVPLGGSGVAGSGAEGTVEGSGAEGVQIISFSHFLPRIDLLPEKRMLLYPNLAKMAGSHWLEARVRSVHGPHGGPTACHVFGHTHFHWDSWVDGIRLVDGIRWVGWHQVGGVAACVQASK